MSHKRKHSKTSGNLHDAFYGDHPITIVTQHDSIKRLVQDGFMVTYPYYTEEEGAGADMQIYLSTESGDYPEIIVSGLGGHVWTEELIDEAVAFFVKHVFSPANAGMLKTSAQWLAELYPDTVVYDPDGWDRKNYEFSFFKERITKKEFEKRMLHSTSIKGLLPEKALKNMI